MGTWNWCSGGLKADRPLISVGDNVTPRNHFHLYFPSPFYHLYSIPSHTSLTPFLWLSVWPAIKSQSHVPSQCQQAKIHNGIVFRYKFASEIWEVLWNITQRSPDTIIPTFWKIILPPSSGRIVSQRNICPPPRMCVDYWPIYWPHFILCLFYDARLYDVGWYLMNDEL